MQSLLFEISRLYRYNFKWKSTKFYWRSRKINSAVTQYNSDTTSAFFFYCNLPFNDCLCSVISNKSDTSDKCITYAALVGSRILPMISFFLQIILVREIFSFSTDCPRIVIFTLWITSIFAFIGIPISIYWNDCFQVYITIILMFTGMLLSTLGIYIM